MAKVRTIDEFKLGDAYEETRLVSDSDVRGFADVSGDQNRIHLDETYARATRFGGRIAHGALLGAYISKVLGMDFPGHGAIYLSQETEFLKPAFVGTTIRLRFQVAEIDVANRVLTLSNEISSSDGSLLARGKSRVKLPKGN